MSTRPRFDLDDLVRVFPDGIEAGCLDLAFEDDVAGRLDVHLGRSVLERSACIGHGRRFVDRDFDLVNDVFGLFLARRHNGGNRLADEAHHAVGKHRLADRLVVELVQHRSDLLYALEVGRRDHHVLHLVPRYFSIFPAATGLRTKRTQ